MQISEIYKKYHIHKGLQEHMVRVAAVAKQICDAGTMPLATEHIVSACLVHDMGNLIKSDFVTFPEFFEPEGTAYWQKQQQEMIDRYGNDHDVASESMVHDMNLNKETLQYFEAFGGPAAERVAQGDNIGEMIAHYSDLRVAPNNVISLKERMDDIRERYRARDLQHFTPDKINERERLTEIMETKIFAVSTITPEDITDESIAPIEAELVHWEVT